MDEPQKPWVRSRTRHSITLSWAAPEEDDDSPPGRPGFVLQQEDRLAGWLTVYTGYSNTREVKGLGPGKCYNFRVKHVCQRGESSWSTALTAATQEDQVPTTVLYRAIQRGQAQAVRKVLTNRPTALHSHDRAGVPPLVRAAEKGDSQLVNLLLNSGAGVNCATQFGDRTALMASCFHGHLDVARLLCERGASWALKDRIGCTALHAAVLSSHLEVTTFAVRNGAHIEAKDSHNWTPLMRGIVLDCSGEVVEALLSLGADPNCCGDGSLTCLMHAVLHGRPDTAALLLQAGADTDVRDGHGHTALDMARGRPHLQEIVALLDHESGSPAEDNMA